MVGPCFVGAFPLVAVGPAWGVVGPAWGEAGHVGLEVGHAGLEVGHAGLKVDIAHLQILDEGQRSWVGACWEGVPQ